MPNIPSKSRTQIEFKSLEDFIEKENIVRFIDAFVEKIELEKISFIYPFQLHAYSNTIC